MLKKLIFALVFVTVSALYGPTSSVVHLTVNNFDKKVIEKPNIWIVEFYAPWCGHCQQFAPEYEKAAKALKGIVRVGAVNAEEESELAGRYQVRGFPTIKIFGYDKLKPQDYDDDRTGKALSKAVIEVIKKKIDNEFGAKVEERKNDTKTFFEEGEGAIELQDDTFEDLVNNSEDLWLVAFLAPWCNHCKIFAPNFASAAKELKGKAKLGTIDSTAQISTTMKYNVSGYPTVKYFPPGLKNMNVVEEYDGGRSTIDIKIWVLDKLKQLAPPPEVVELTSKVSFDACNENILCVVSVLPHILDCQKECRNNYLNLLRNISAAYKDKDWGWMWTQAGSQILFEQALGMDGFGYPMMTIINARKMTHVLLKGSFSKSGISDLLRSISLGKSFSSPIKGAILPNIIQTEPWDGENAPLIQEEELYNDIPSDRDEL